MPAFQSKCLRIIVDVPWYVWNVTLHRNLDMPTTKDHFWKLAQSFYDRLPGATNLLIQGLGYYGALEHAFMHLRLRPSMVTRFICLVGTLMRKAPLPLVLPFYTDYSPQSSHTTTKHHCTELLSKGKFHYMLLFVCGIGQIALVFELYLSSYLLPAAQCDFQMTAQEKGLLNSISYAGVILSSPLWGFLADTQGRKKILIISLVCDGIIGVLSSLAPNYSTLLAFRFFNGFL
uniref:Major facilitator superfamily (MFS) profile domain-containing protein n=1 Tax=Timema genevievae TaxID=629358 RepID=A0A7R9PS80_TIMGE|nr:unnamed protein product [Timema genevievae]